MAQPLFGHSNTLGIPSTPALFGNNPTSLFGANNNQPKPDVSNKPASGLFSGQSTQIGGNPVFGGTNQPQSQTANLFPAPSGNNDILKSKTQASEQQKAPSAPAGGLFGFNATQGKSGTGEEVFKQSQTMPAKNLSNLFGSQANPVNAQTNQLGVSGESKPSLFSTQATIQTTTAPVNTAGQQQTTANPAQGLQKSQTLAPSAAGLFGDLTKSATAPAQTSGIFGSQQKSSNAPTTQPNAGEQKQTLFQATAPLNPSGQQQTSTPPAQGLFKSQTIQPSAGGLFGDQPKSQPAPTAAAKEESKQNSQQKPATPNLTQNEGGKNDQDQQQTQVQAPQPVPEKVSETEEKKEAFLKQPFEFISKKWISTVKQNEEAFNAAIQQVQDQELSLITALGNLEKLEAQSLLVSETQKANLKELNDINMHQSVILDDLCKIEEELDSYYQGQIAHQNQNKYLTKLFGQPQSDSQSSREKVLTQALTLESEIDGLRSDLNKCTQQMSRSDDEYKSAADKYLLRGDPLKEQQVNNIEESLRVFYESMKWIENSTTDLQFQLREVQKKLKDY